MLQIRHSVVRQFHEPDLIFIAFPVQIDKPAPNDGPVSEEILLPNGNVVRNNFSRELFPSKEFSFDLHD